MTIDDTIAKALKDTAYRSGKSYKQVVNETLRAGLSANRVKDTVSPYRLKPVSMGDVSGGYNLTKALELSDYLVSPVLPISIPWKTETDIFWAIR